MARRPITRLLVCINKRYQFDKPSCGARGSEVLAALLAKEVRRRGLDLVVEPIACLGQCHRGPNVRLAPGGDFLFHFSEADIPGLLDRLREPGGRPE